MRCVEYKELISAYVDDEVSSKELRVLLEHLKVCAECKAEVVNFTVQKQGIRTAIASDEVVTPEPGFSARVLAEINRVSGPSLRDSHVRELVGVFLSRLFSGSLRVPTYALALGAMVMVAVSGISIIIKESAVMAPPHKRLLNVYELQAKASASSNPYLSSAIDGNGESIVYQHLACSSAETIGSEPCVLEYAAYATTK